MRRTIWVISVLAILSLSAVASSDVSSRPELPTVESCATEPTITDVDRADIAWLNSTDEVEHGGGLNACGCHFNRRTGECHCHQRRGCGCPCQPASC